MDTTEMILREWEKAGGHYAQAARMVREELKREGGKPSQKSKEA